MHIASNAISMDVKYLGVSPSSKASVYQSTARSGPTTVVVDFHFKVTEEEAFRLSSALLASNLSHSRYKFELTRATFESLDEAVRRKATTDVLRRLATVWTANPNLSSITADDLARTDWARPEDPLLTQHFLAGLASTEKLRSFTTLALRLINAKPSEVLDEVETPASTYSMFQALYSLSHRRAYTTDSGFRETLALARKTIDESSSFPFSVLDLSREDVETLGSLSFLPPGKLIRELLALVREERSHFDGNMLDQRARLTGPKLTGLFTDTSTVSRSKSLVRQMSGQDLFFRPRFSSQTPLRIFHQPDFYLLARAVRMLGPGEGSRTYLAALESERSLEFRLDYLINLTPDSLIFEWQEVLSP